MCQPSFRDHGARWINNTKNMLHNMEFLLQESNKSKNIKIFYYYVFFKDQSFWLVFDRNSFVLTIGSSNVKPPTLSRDDRAQHTERRLTLPLLSSWQ